jgi:hypothetical protein
LTAKLFGDEFCRIGIDQVTGLHHLALFHHELDDVDGALGHALCQFLNGDRFGQPHFARDFLARLALTHLRTADLFLPALHGSHGA